MNANVFRRSGGATGPPFCTTHKCGGNRVVVPPRIIFRYLAHCARRDSRCLPGRFIQTGRVVSNRLSSRIVNAHGGRRRPPPPRHPPPPPLAHIGLLSSTLKFKPPVNYSYVVLFFSPPILRPATKTSTRVRFPRCRRLWMAGGCGIALRLTSVRTCSLRER